MTAWYIYGGLNVFWILAFSLAEYFYITRIRIQDPGFKKVGVVQSVPDNPRTSKSAVMKSYTWESIGQDVDAGYYIALK